MSYTYYRRYRPRKKSSNFSSFFWLVIFLGILTLIFWLISNIFNSIKEEKRDDAILTINKGVADVIVFGSEKAKPAANSQIVLEGDSIYTFPGSYATLSFFNGTELRLDEDTRVLFDSFETKEKDDIVHIKLLSGRLYVEHLPKEVGAMQLVVMTDVMDMISFSGDFLAANLAQEEYVYGLRGQLNIQYVDRSGPEVVVVEALTIGSGSKSHFNAQKERDFLARSAVLLAEDFEDDLLEDVFYQWNLGQVNLNELPDPELPDEKEEELEPEPEPEVEEEEIKDEEPIAAEPLKISIISPTSSSTIHESAIALEGRIISGEASRVTVTWSGNGQAYPLGLFEAGSDSFRYVADVNYQNYALGENTYTVVAYDEVGNVSNTIVVQLTAEF